MPKAMVLNGTNLDQLGRRQPELYGHATLDDVRRLCESESRALGIEIDFRQSNHEGVLIDWLHEAEAHWAGVVLNPGALARTSLALHDAVAAMTRPVVEVHISNIYRRESFRPPSQLSRAATGVICGFGIDGYALGLRALSDHLARSGGTPA